MVNENNKQEIQVFDKEIRGLFKESVAGISLDEGSKGRLVSLKDTVIPLTPWQRFLEREISIPVSAVSATAGAMVIAMAIFLNTLILPGEIPQPKYEIIEMHSAISYNRPNK